MKILIVRMWAEEININNYNCQEIGLAKSLIRKGNICDIVLYTSSNEKEIDYSFDKGKKIHIYYLNAKKILKNCFYNKKLYDIIKNYDVIQSAEYDQIANMLLYKKLKNKLVIYHGPYKSRFTKRYPIKCLISDIIYLLNPKYKNVKIIAKSNLAKQFLNEKGFKNVKTVGVGLDTEIFNNKKSNEQINELKNIKKNNKYILYIGKIEERRNILFLLQVFNKIQQEYKKVKLILVGKGETEYVNKCKEYIVNNNLNSKVITYESISQSELPELYKCCEIFALPTQYEIFGMVMLEALYFGLKVITTMNGGSSTIINKKNGIICENNDFEQWYQAIIKALKEPKNNETFKYTWDNLVQEFIDVYNK